MTYDEIRNLAEQEYLQVVHQLEALSDGRAGKVGLMLIERRHEPGRKEVKVFPTDLGCDLGRVFVDPNNEGFFDQPVERQAARQALAGLSVALEHLPRVALGSLAVFLSIARNQRRFGIEGMPFGVLGEQVGIANFARHVTLLGEGTYEKPGLGLIRLVVSPKDRRVKLPELTETGHRAVAEIAGAVLSRSVVAPRKVKPEVLSKLANPDGMDALSDDDYVVVFDAPESGPGDSINPDA